MKNATRICCQGLPQRCRLCWIEAGKPDGWGHSAPPKPAPKSKPRPVAIPVLPCIYFGEPLTGFERQAAGLRHGPDWRHCEHPETPLGPNVCTCNGCGPLRPGGKGCRGYIADQGDDSAGLQTPVIRNLAYHLWPKRGSGWQASVAELKKRLWLFNGRRVVGIVTDPMSESADAVKAAFGDTIHEYIELRNDPKLREVVTFVPMLERVQSRSPREVVFCAHAKGTDAIGSGRDGNKTCGRWAEIMYESCLDYWPLVEERLKNYPLAGSFKKIGRCFEGSESAWHYSGTFFWLRSADAFSRQWRIVDRHWWGTESWVGLHYRPNEAGVLFCEGQQTDMDLYQRPTFDRIEAEYERWKSQHAQERMAAHAL